MRLLGRSQTYTNPSFDGSAQSGEALPGPADLLCAALSACILKNVERFSHMLPFRYESASLEVTAEREEPPPRIVRMHYRLRVVTDEPPARVELLHKNIRKFGTITNTLAAACELPAYLSRLGPVGLALAGADPADRARVVEAIAPAFAPFRRGDEIRFSAACWRVDASV